MEKVVIIGNGIAGHSALQEILKKGRDFDITVVWNEVPRTYVRTQIINYAMGRVKEDKFYLSREDYYKEKGVHSIHAEVTDLDPMARQVTLSNGEGLPYDRLIIATGSYNFVPPVKAEGHSTLTTIDSSSIRDLAGVYTMRNLKDAEGFGRDLQTARNAVVSGGGLLGLEAAGSLVDAGLDVTTVEFAPRLLPRQLDRDSSALFQKQAEAYGLTFILGDSIDTVFFEEDQPVRVRLVSGRELKCDLLLFSIGVRSNIAPFLEKLTIGRGIQIDDYAQTSDPNIFCCGDAAEYKGLVYGNWGFSSNSGKTAGQNAAGQHNVMKPYVLNTLFHSLGTRVFSTGLVDFDDPDLKSYTRGEADKDYVKLFFRDDRLTAGILMGDTTRGQKLARAIDAAMGYEEAVETFGR